MRAAALLLLPLATPAWAQAPGFGPVQLGMGREAAIAAAGPGALVGPLCGAAEGVLFEAPDAGQPGAQLMAMFEHGRVSEMELSRPNPEGGVEEAACHARAEARLAALRARHALPAPEASATESAGIRERRFVAEGPPGRATALSRWSARTGACFVTLRLAAPGAAGVIR